MRLTCQVWLMETVYSLVQAQANGKHGHSHEVWPKSSADSAAHFADKTRGKTSMEMANSEQIQMVEPKEDLVHCCYCQKVSLRPSQMEATNKFQF
jgi:hypothetical protein